MAEADPDPVEAGEGGGEASAPVVATPPVEVLESEEEKELALTPHWRLRRFLVITALDIALWLLMVAFIQTGTPPSVYFVLLLPFYATALLFGLRTPKRFRHKKQKTTRERLTFTNRLALAILTFVVVYIPFTFVSNKIIPLAPMVEFFLFVLVLYVLYRLVGRSVGVAPSIEALPPTTHRRHKQVVLPIDDPHYQRTLFLNYEFVDRGRGGRVLAKRIENAMENLGIPPERRRAIVEDLEDYREGFHWGLGISRQSRERRSNRRERRSQVLKTVYNKFNLELEQGT